MSEYLPDFERALRNTYWRRQELMKEIEWLESRDDPWLAKIVERYRNRIGQENDLAKMLEEKIEEIKKTK